MPDPTHLGRPSAEAAISNPPSVSVIVPVFGRGGCLAQSIGSLDPQTYGGDIQIIVVGGAGEIDPEAIRAAAAKGSLTTVEGVAPREALEVGCSRADGEILVVLPAGDLAFEDRISRHVEAIVHGGATISTSHPALIDDIDRRVIAACAPAFFPPAGLLTGLQAFERLFYGENVVCLGTAAFTPDLHRACGPFRPELPQALQEHDFWLRAACLGAAFHVSEDPLSRHRLYALAPEPPDMGPPRLEMLRAASARLSEADVTDLYRKLVAPPPAGAARGDIVALLHVKHADAAVQAQGLQMLLDGFACDDDADRLWNCLGLREDVVRNRLSTLAHQSLTVHQ